MPSNPGISIRILYQFLSGLAYLAMGGYMIYLYRTLPDEKAADWMPIVGGAALAYGLFRVINGVITYRRQQRENSLS